MIDRHLTSEVLSAFGLSSGAAVRRQSSGIDADIVIKKHHQPVRDTLERVIQGSALVALFAVKITRAQFRRGLRNHIFGAMPASILNEDRITIA